MTRTFTLPDSATHSDSQRLMSRVSHAEPTATHHPRPLGGESVSRGATANRAGTSRETGRTTH